MDEKMIPYFSHEGDMARAERTNRRLVTIIIILIGVIVLFAGALITTNALWINYERQFKDTIVEIEAEQETSEGNNYIVGGNLNGEAEGQSDN